MQIIISKSSQKQTTFSFKYFAPNKKSPIFVPAKQSKRSFIIGQLPEWPNGADCNSAGVAFGGSNPSLPTNYFAEIAQSIEH